MPLAAGKINAATLFTSLTHPQGEGPVRVLLVREDAAKLRGLGIDRAPLLQVATRKTGAETLAAVEAETRMASGGFHRASRQYRFRTSAGWTAWMAPTQTMWLAPEDPAGIKRAHVEALAEDLIHPEWTTEPETPAVDARTPEVTPAPPRDQLLAYSQGLPVVELAYSSLAAGVQVAPLPAPVPSRERLLAYSRARMAEDLEALDPEEVRAPAIHRVVPGDVVRIHQGVRLYEVLRVEEDRARNNLTGEVADMTMARVVPCDPEDHREPQWVHVDLLHVVPPVARLRTQVISHDVAISQDVVVVAGAGWDPERGEARRVALIRVDGTRVLAIFRTTVLGPGGCPVAVVRIGDSLVVDGRCYRVVWHGEPGEPILEPARWRDRLPV